MEDVRNVADDSTVDQESRRRKRSVWEAWQKEALLKAFGKNPSPSFGARQDLARELGLPECRVRIWFQNRRCRTRQVRQGPRGSEDPSMLAAPQRPEEPGARAQGRRHAEERRTRLRTRLSSAQLKILLQAFERDPKPPYAAREQLARRTALPEDTIQIWFQNRRARCSRRRPLDIPLHQGSGRRGVALQDSMASAELREQPQELPGREAELAQDSSLPLAAAAATAAAAAVGPHPLTLTSPLTSWPVSLPAADTQPSGSSLDDPEPRSVAKSSCPVSYLLFDEILPELQLTDTQDPPDQWEHLEPSLEAPLDPEEYEALLLDLL